MPTTRSQTGTLPGTIERLIAVAAGASMSSSGGANRTSHSTNENRRTAEGRNAGYVDFPVLPIFQKFGTNVNLQDGICIIRTLGDGSYEAINLSQISHTTLTSEETGRQIGQVEGRAKAMTLSGEEWAALKYKVEQAIRAADLKIFRLEKLPIELRFRIYEFALIGQKTLKNYKREVCGNFKTLATALLETCKWVYYEARPIFWRNSMEVATINHFSAPMIKIMKEKLRDVAFSWWGFSKKDKDTLQFFATCPNLRILNVLITTYTIHTDYHKPQHKFQKEASISKFSKCNGFDAMMDLRGLDRVNVRRDMGEPPSFLSVTTAELKAFEDFLNVHLTQPKSVILAPLPKKTRIQLREAAKLAKFEEMFGDKPRLPSRFGRGAAVAARARVAAQLNQSEEDDEENDEDA